MFSQVRKSEDIDERLLRHIVLNCIRSYRMKFKNYGDLIVCADSSNNWRKEVFPYYKANRKKDRDKSPLDWDKIFACFDSIRKDLDEYFPYPMIAVDKTEADDIIAVLAEIIDDQNVLILSGDTDFVQLHSPTVSQYDPVRKKNIKIADTQAYLKEHIIEGDRSDGIPNVLSEDDTLVMGKRMKTLTKKRKDFLINTDPSDYPSVEKRNFQRNSQLIDLSYIPENLKLDIRAKYVNKPQKDKSKLFNYFYDKRMTQFIEAISEF